MEGITLMYMKQKIEFHPINNRDYAAVFTTDHGRKVYLSLQRDNENYSVTECRYIDRTRHSVPHKLVTRRFPFHSLGNILQNELDKTAREIVFHSERISPQTLIHENAASHAPRILIFLREGDTLRTVFKNLFRRTIYLEMTRRENKTVMSACYYTDSRDGGNHRLPHSVVSFSCGTSLGEILAWVNEELEGGFTHILIAEENNIDLQMPICGAI